MARREVPKEYRVGEQMLTVKDVADHLGTTEETVRVWIREGMLAALSFGGAVGYRIEPSELKRFKDSRRVGATVERGLAYAAEGREGYS